MNSSEKAEIQSSGENDLITEASKNSQVTLNAIVRLHGSWKSLFLVKSKYKEDSCVFPFISKVRTVKQLQSIKCACPGFVVQVTGCLNLTELEQ